MALAFRLRAIRDVQMRYLNKFSAFICESAAMHANYSTNGFLLNSRSISSSLHQWHKINRMNSTCDSMNIGRSFTPLKYRERRMSSTPAKPQPKGLQKGSLGVSLSSPGFIYEPYVPRARLPFWERWFTLRGWRRLKEDVMLEFRSAYAIHKLRKKGYSKKKMYEEAVALYKEINKSLAGGEKGTLRKLVTEVMYSEVKNELKKRELKWSSIYLEIFEPIKVRTLRARAIGVDRTDLNKAFIQLTLEFVSKQKFEGYDCEGKVVAGDKDKEILVRDIWVFEKSLFHPKSYWRLCGRLKV